MQRIYPVTAIGAHDQAAKAITLTQRNDAVDSGGNQLEKKSACSCNLKSWFRLLVCFSLEPISSSVGVPDPSNLAGVTVRSYYGPIQVSVQTS